MDACTILLNEAILLENEDKVRDILKDCHNVDDWYSGSSAIFRAFTKYNVNETIVELLKENVADINALNSFGETILTHLAPFGTLYNVELAIKHGADPFKTNSKGMSPLELASKNENAKVEKYLTGLSVEKVRKEYISNIEEIKNSIRGKYEN